MINAPNCTHTTNPFCQKTNHFASGVIFFKSSTKTDRDMLMGGGWLLFSELNFYNTAMPQQQPVMWPFFDIDERGESELQVAITSSTLFK